MAVGIHRHARVVIDRAALYHNIHSEVKRLDPGTRLFMVVKANGYGHGAVEVARVAKKAGATGFCVAILDEALELRKAGITEPILVLGITAPEVVPLAVRQRISLTVSSVAWLRVADRVLTRSAVPGRLRIHLGLDTGMGRIGFQTSRALRGAIGEMHQHADRFNFEGIFTHFATADSPNGRYFRLQLTRFRRLMSVVHPHPRFVHVANSAAGLWHRKCGGNLIRYGAAGYGLNPSCGALRPPFPLIPAMSVEAVLSHVKLVKAGRSLGYGATYTAGTDQWIGTVPVGYADGIRRSLRGFHVLIKGRFCPIVGQICMDQLMVRLPSSFPVGTKVTLVGKNGQHRITLQAMADYAHTIHYELACGFTRRLPRVYVN